MNAGHTFKQGFNGLLKRLGGTILVHKNHGKQDNSITEHMGLKNHKEHNPDKIMFQFSEKIDINVGDVLQQKESSDLWEVYETSDNIVAGTFIFFEAYVTKSGSKIAHPSSGTTSVIIEGANLGGIQIGTTNSKQKVSVTVSPVKPELEALRRLVIEATDIDELDKEDIQLALDRVEDLSTRDKSPGLIKKVKDKIDLIETLLNVSVKASAAAPHFLAIVDKLTNL